MIGENAFGCDSDIHTLQWNTELEWDIWNGNSPFFLVDVSNNYSY
jgi:hypothetical protein